MTDSWEKAVLLIVSPTVDGVEDWEFDIFCFSYRSVVEKNVVKVDLLVIRDEADKDNPNQVL